jgi:hypothetical protein
MEATVAEDDKWMIENYVDWRQVYGDHVADLPFVECADGDQDPCPGILIDFFPRNEGNCIYLVQHYPDASETLCVSVSQIEPLAEKLKQVLALLKNDKS